MNFMDPSEYPAHHDPATSDAEAVEERAAILEYQGGFARAEAEEIAARQPSFTHQTNLFVLRQNAIEISRRKRVRR